MQLYGNKVGGVTFEDSDTEPSLWKVEVRAGRFLCGVKCVYADGTETEWHGGQGGSLDPNPSESIFQLDEGEAISTIRLWTGDEIDAIQFQTTKGRFSERYGGQSGYPVILRGNEGYKEKPLVGFVGRSGDRIDAIAPVWSRKQPAHDSAYWVGKPAGGVGTGGEFDMIWGVPDPLTTRLSTIKIKCDARIDSIECEWNIQGSSEKKSSGVAGGRGGKVKEFTLQPDERIIRVEGRASDRIHQLQFFTNKRQSEVYGAGAPKQFIWTSNSNDSRQTASDPQMTLLGFSGRADHEIVTLAPIWHVGPIIKATLEMDPIPPESLTNVQQSEGKTLTQRLVNRSNATTNQKYVFQYERKQESTLSMSTDSRTRLGAKFSYEITSGGGVSIPSVADASFELKTGYEVSGEKESGKSRTDGTTKSKTETTTYEGSVDVGPKMSIEVKTTVYFYQCSDVKWTGKLRVEYGGGVKRMYEVDGVLDAFTTSDVSVEMDDILEKGK